MWVELVTEVFPEAEFREPVSETAVGEIERRLGQPVPGDLRGLLLETDGVRDDDLVAVVWTAEQIVTQNTMFRTYPDFVELYEPFDKLLFFGAGAGGDQFAYRPDDPGSGVIVWEHETDDRRKVADDLADYFRRRLTSEDDGWYVDYE